MATSPKIGQDSALGSLSAVPNSLLGAKVLGCLEPGAILRCRALSARARRVVETDGAAAAISTWLAQSFRWDPPVELQAGSEHYPVLPPILLPAAPDTERRLERFVAASGWQGWRLAWILREADCNGTGAIAWAGSPTGPFVRMMQRFSAETDAVKLAIDSGDKGRQPLTRAVVEAVTKALFAPCSTGPIPHGAAVAQYARATTVYSLPTRPEGTIKALKAEALVGIWKPGKLVDASPEASGGSAASGFGAAAVAAGSGGHLTFKFVANVAPELADLGSRHAKRSSKESKKVKKHSGSATTASENTPSVSHGRRLAVIALFNALAPPAELGSAAYPCGPMVHELVGYSGPPIALPMGGVPIAGVRPEDNPPPAGPPSLRCVHIGLGKGRCDVLPIAQRQLTHVFLDRTNINFVDAVGTGDTDDGDSSSLLECLVLRGIHGGKGRELALVDAPALTKLRVLHLCSDQPGPPAIAMPRNGWERVAFASTLEELHITADVARDSEEHMGAIARFAASAPRLWLLDVRPCSATFRSGAKSVLPQMLADVGTLAALEVLGVGAVGGDSAEEVAGAPPIRAPKLRLLIRQGDAPVPLGPTDRPVLHDVRVQLDSLYTPGMVLANQELLRRKAAAAMAPAHAFKAATLPMTVDAATMVGPECERTFAIDEAPPAPKGPTSFPHLAIKL